MVLLPSLLNVASPVPLAASVVAVAIVTSALLVRHSSNKQSDNASPSATGKTMRKIHSLPGAWPLLGDLFAYIRNEDRFHDWVAETSLSFQNEPWRLRIVGQDDMVVVSTPEAFDAVLVSHFHDFPNGEFSNLVMSGLFGTSLMTLDGDDWARVRKAASKFFTARALRVCMLQTMRKNVHQLYESLDASAATGKSIDLFNLLGQFTLQTFAEIGLGVDFRWIGQHEPHPLERTIRLASPATMRRFRVPAFWWQFEKYVGFGPEREMMDGTNDARVWLGGIVDQWLATFKRRQADRLSAKGNEEDLAACSKDESEIKSILELFFEHSHEDTEGMRPDDLIDFLLTFVLAAQDTSALTLSRMFLLLTKYPDVEARIQAEMKTMFTSLGLAHDTYLTTDHVQHLVYLEATIRETLRLYPTVPIMQKEAAKDTVICGDIPVRKGEQWCLPIYALARNPDVWGPDASEFKPERWIDPKTGTLLTVPATKFPAFSAGPRVCIGMKLGLLELRVVAANLAHRYRFSLAEPNDGDYIVAITLSLKKPLSVHVKRASAEAS